MLAEGVDLLVATVGRAALLVESGALVLRGDVVRNVVLDEVDVLVLDESFPIHAIVSQSQAVRRDCSIGR